MATKPPTSYEWWWKNFKRSAVDSISEALAPIRSFWVWRYNMVNAHVRHVHRDIIPHVYWVYMHTGCFENCGLWRISYFQEIWDDLGWHSVYRMIRMHNRHNHSTAANKRRIRLWWLALSMYNTCTGVHLKSTNIVECILHSIYIQLLSYDIHALFNATLLHTSTIMRMFY